MADIASRQNMTIYELAKFSIANQTTPGSASQISKSGIISSEIGKTERKFIDDHRKIYMDSMSSTLNGKDRMPMLIFFTHILTMVMVFPEGLVRDGSSSA